MASSPWAELASWLLLPALVVALSAGWAVAIATTTTTAAIPSGTMSAPGMSRLLALLDRVV